MGPDPGRIVDRSDFAVELSLARERIGKTVRALAKEVGEPPATIGGYLSGQHLPPVRQTDMFRRLLGALGISDEAEVTRWVDALARVRRKPGPRPAGAATPYRGLEGFGTDDRDWFFGRESLTEALLGKLSDRVQDPVGGPAVMVVGPSGSGKSSLLRAGLIPAVLNGGLGNDLAWRCVLFSPGTEPVRALARQLQTLTGAEPAELEAGLRSDTFDWGAATSEAEGAVVVVDQFEEVFTACADEAERQAFMAALRRVSRVEAPQRRRVVVVLGLRADFYGRAAREPALVPVMQDHQVLVGPMTAEQLRRAIVEPARLAGYEVDADLVDLLISEFVPRGSPSGLHDPGALPLLSHALLETFRRARRGRLTVANYVETGGINGAVHQTAEAVYEELTSDERVLARRVFLRLVNIDDDIVTRRRVMRVELPSDGLSENGGTVGGAEHPATSDNSDRLDEGTVLGRVLDRFVAHRLLTMNEKTVEISHEALLSAWPRLGEWLDGDRDGLRGRRQLSEAARMWLDSDQDSAGLLRGARLEAARAWASSPDNSGDLNELERSFLDASADHDRSERSAARRRTRLLQTLLVVVTALAVTAGILAAVAVTARNNAVNARDVALSRQVAIEADRLRATDPSLAAQVALAGYRISATPEALSALLDSTAVPTPTRLLGQAGSTALAVTADGQTMAVSRSIDGSVQLFSLPPAGQPKKLGVLTSSQKGTQPFAVAFNPDGSTIAAGGTDNAVRLWDVADRTHPRILGQALGGFTEPVQSVVFSPDGRTLAAGGTAAGVLRWDVSSPAQPTSLAPLTGMTGTTQTVAFSPDGQTLAAAGTDGTVRIWDVSHSDQGGLLAQLNGTSAITSTVNTVTYSPDGHLLAAGRKDKTVTVWDVSDVRAPIEVAPALGGFGSWVNNVVFSPDGRTLAAGSSDGNVKFWTVDGWQQLATSLPDPQPITAIRFVPGRDELLSADIDGTTRLWPLPGPVINGPVDTVFALSYSSDGRRFAVIPGQGDTHVAIWDTSNNGHPSELGRVTLPVGLGNVAGSGALSPDGTILAVGTSKGSVQMWDIADPTKPVVLGNPLTQSTSKLLVEQVAFSDDGHLLAAGGNDNTVVLWSVTDPAHPAMLARLSGPTSLVLGMAFSPDRRLLAAASADTSIRLWDIGTPSHPVAVATLTGFDTYANSVAFSANGHLLAAGSSDKTIRLWDITDPRHPKSIGKPIDGPANTVYAVAFSPNSRSLAAAVTDGTVWEWDLSDLVHPRHIATLEAIPGETFIVTYSPDGNILAAAGDQRTVHFWNTDPNQTANNICSNAGDPITVKEWVQYIPGRPYKPPCP